MAWVNAYFTNSCRTLTKVRSGHFHLLLDFKFSYTPLVSHFKFLSMWSSHPTCREIVGKSWMVNIVGCPMFVLTEKLKKLKYTLKA